MRLIIPELAIGAVMPNGSYFLNQEIVDMRNIPLDYIQDTGKRTSKRNRASTNELQRYQRI